VSWYRFSWSESALMLIEEIQAPVLRQGYDNYLGYAYA